MMPVWSQEAPLPLDAAPDRHRVVVAGPDDAGFRLDRVLAAAVADLSRSRLKALIENGRVGSGGRTIDDPSYRVKPGQSFDLDLPEPVADEPAPQPMALVVLHEDEHLLVVDKPAGLVVHPAAGNPDHTLVNALLAHCGDSLSGIGGVKRPGIVHRLDKDTSGLMVVAKTDAAHAALSAQFADRTLSREYLAVVHFVPRPSEGTIAAPIGRSPRDRKRMAVVASGRPALTHYRVARAFGVQAALVECTLGTGRTHQIRVHLASIGHPVVGDPLYRGGAGRAGRARATAATETFPRQALHAARLRFRHPSDQQMVGFSSPLPKDMNDLVLRLGACSH